MKDTYKITENAVLTNLCVCVCVIHVYMCVMRACVCCVCIWVLYLKNCSVVLSLETIQLQSNTNWVKANAGQTGLYRVNYDMSDWKQFVSMLLSDHTVRCLLNHMMGKYDIVHM